MPAFVTWRLWGSLPQTRVFSSEHLTSGEVFVVWDRILDNARCGAVFLRQRTIAALVRDRLLVMAEGRLCSLHAYVVMPNHVHVLWTPQIALCDLLRHVKGPTAREANKILGRPGEQFWQEEYFDRLVRSEREFGQIRRYIEWNPVKAGLVAHPGAFEWSSAWEGKEELKPVAG